MNILCTFPGRYGDILWALPTVRELSRLHGKVDMGIMPQYESLLPLLNSQSYIRRAFTIPEWILQHSMWGDQPWQSPWVGCVVDDNLVDYDCKYDLGYRHHPGKDNPLITFTAKQQAITLKDPVLPFIDTHLPEEDYTKPFVTYCFNPEYAELKDRFRNVLFEALPDTKFLDTSSMTWMVAAIMIKCSAAYVGCRSSNHVLAHGVGQKNVFIFDPHPSHNHHGMFGTTFTCPYRDEHEGHFQLSPEEEGRLAANFIKQWVKEKVCV